nr:ribonuclease H-like domain-containing protein [Tanacetum cinerariifolium]
HEIDQHLVYEDLDQMNKEEFEEYDLKHQMAMLSIKVHRFEKKHGRKIKFNGRENVRIKIASDADSKGEVVSGDNVIPAGVSVSAGDVVAAVVSPQSETKFALIGSTRKILGKVTVKTKNFNFENVLYVKELQHFNLISVSQICDQTHRVLFTKNECLVLSKDFPLPDPSMVILFIPRKHNLYTFGLNDLAPKGPLTCLIAKASQNESTLWHMRLGHVNFKNMNKLGLVKHGCLTLIILLTL